MELERTSQRTEQRDAVALLQIGEERRAFPDGPTRLSWPGIAYFRVRPRWVRYSDFRVTPTRDAPLVVERSF